MATAFASRPPHAFPLPFQHTERNYFQEHSGLRNMCAASIYETPRDGKENARRAKRSRLPPSYQYDFDATVSDALALRLEARLACGLGRTTSWRDLRRERAKAPVSDSSTSRQFSATSSEQSLPVEDWSGDYAFEDDVNPFIVPDEDMKDSINYPVHIANMTNYGQTGGRSDTQAVTPLAPISHQPANSFRPRELHGESHDSKDALSPQPVHNFSTPAKVLESESRSDNEVYCWEMPGSSPLSCDITMSLSVTDGDAYASRLSLRDRAAHDHHEELSRSYHTHYRPLTIRPLPRHIGGKKNGRVAIPLRRELHKSRLLSRVCFLDVEAPELDFVDERTMEFLLDTQALLLRGHLGVPSLSSYAIHASPKLGTPSRRFKWSRAHVFPARVKDYGKAAESMLARRRAEAAKGRR